VFDERMRQRLRDLASYDEPGLDVAARQRILNTITTTGPAVVRRARMERAAIGSGAFVLAAAAGVVLFLRFGGAEPANVASHAAAQTEQRTMAAPPGPVARACESRKVLPGAAFVDGEAGRTLDLGSVAFATATPGSQVTLEENAPCSTVIALKSGKIMVDARDLGGGELKVRAHGTDVLVKGTVFAVALAGDDVTVDVAEGRVVVNHKSDKPRNVAAGIRVAFTPDLVVESVLEPAQAAELKSAVTADRAAPSSRAGDASKARAESAAQLLSRADALRQAGQLDAARKLYREVGSSGGPTAEAAWLALARMELAAGNTQAAEGATTEREKRFGKGALDPEALWIAVRTQRQAGNEQAARSKAEELVRSWPSSPQAQAARAFLAGKE
jgi:Tfp pilus assembly protein PilF